MLKLKEKLHLNSKELLVYAIFLLFSLRVINWFQYPYIMVGGDFRPPLVREAFAKRVLYTWDEIDFGMPSVYQPRILIPSYFFTTVFQTLGQSLYVSQITAVFLMYFLTSILMYLYVKQLTNGDTIAAFIAALFLTSNVHLIVDREQTAIGLIDMVLMILPCLFAFTRGIKKKSYTMITLSGLLFVLTYGTFPNYRVALLCLITLITTLFFMYIDGGLKVRYRKNRISQSLGVSLNINLIHAYLKYLFVFIVTLFLASTWVIMIVSANFDTFFMAYEQMAAPPFVLKYVQFHDILRLVAKWAFYESAFEKPYVPYAQVYLHNPLIIILSYLPPILAFASLLTSKSCKLTVYFSGVALLSLILTSAYLPEVYSALASSFPLMMAFRESAQWLFFATLSYCILIGITVSALCHKFRNKALHVIAMSLTIALFLSSSFPLITGDVTRNWLSPSINGSYFPHSYLELNNMLPSQYWTVMLPQRCTYIVYNFTGGMLGCGNPYPLVFSKPIVSGVGTEYIRSKNQDLINELHRLIQTNIIYKNVALEGIASASSNETMEFEPGKAIDGQGLNKTRWSSQRSIPQWFEIEWDQTRELSNMNIIFETAYAEDYKIETWNGSNWTTQITVKDNTNSSCKHIFPTPINTTKLRLYFTKATQLYGSVSIWELEVYTRTEEVSKFLGMLGIKYAIVEKNIVWGSLYPASELKLNESKNFGLVREWDEVALFENAYASQKLYVADNIMIYSTLDDILNFSAHSTWSALRHSAFVNANTSNVLIDKTLTAPENFAWKEVSPTKYEASAESNGPFILVFLESYNEHWKISVNGKLIQETNHQKVNAFANGWVIDATGDLDVVIEYEIQSHLTLYVILSIVLPVILLIGKTNITRVMRLIYYKIRFLRQMILRKSNLSESSS